jgi:uncharacterized membrane protein
MYTNIVVRSLIAFFFSFIFLAVILVWLLKIKALYILPLAFLVGVLLTPLLSKISLGEKIVSYYENILRRIIK